jgi:hypothetical protein
MTGTHPEDQPKQPNHINLIAIVAGAAASLSAAVVASFFGVAGTLIGTAVASVVSSLAAAVYAGLLGRTPRLVRRTTTALHAPPKRAGDRRGPPSEEGPRDREPPGAPRDQEPAAARDQEPAAARDREPAGEGGRAGAGGAGGAPVGWPWRRSAVVVGVAVLIFAIAIGAVTGIEAVIKEPIASALGVRDRGQASTSVGVAVDRAGGSATTRGPGPSSSTLPPPSSSQPGQAPPTTQPAPSVTTGGTQPSSTAPSTTAQPSPSTSTGTSASP